MLATTHRRQEATPVCRSNCADFVRRGPEVVRQQIIEKGRPVLKPFVINRHGRLVFPSSFLGEIDFSVIETEEQLTAVIHRDFEAKAPTGTEIRERAESGGYDTRYALMRDLAQNLYWSSRYAITMYDRRPIRWRDVPRRRDDVFLSVLSPWLDGDRKIAAVAAAYEALPPAWDAESEDRIYRLLFDLYQNKLFHGAEVGPLKPTVAEMVEQPTSLVRCLSRYEPDYPVFTYDEILDCTAPAAELEALHRMAMVLHNQYPWNRADARLEEIGKIDDDDFVIMFTPRNREVLDFIRRVKSGSRPHPHPAPPTEVRQVEPIPPIMVQERFAIMPRIESLSVAKGEYVFTNDDVIRNSCYSWSPMTAEDIGRKTGIEARLYTARALEHIALAAAIAALERAGRKPHEIGAVIFCSCTSTRLIPSAATWISGQLGIYQTHASFDLIAACSGFPYGLGEATRILQDIRRPVLLVCAEKFSDKIGSVRTSRMIFGDGASALVIAPAGDGQQSDIEVLQTYASGPASEVNSIIWPNPDFDNDITVWGPEVKALVHRYLGQMTGELRSLPHPDGADGALVDAIDLVVPHQANRTMVTTLATDAGIAEDKLYFNIDRVGNISAASIPIAIADAVADGVIDRPMRIFAPGFGAGAVAGYAVLRLDPSIVVPADAGPLATADGGPETRATSSEDVQVAFGG
jgi:3-oxoacyl-(acyl-carrier-protein) synthase III